ncbi:hypothetical protein Cri9333_0664 [Crinalium epipsammum PCC 9333]|uniref:Uncharacterized protein n=1 Tax=Crinalium epipsammum PCC 9333 TaxID=1173022 RepID=K9VU34_9CYAN|nr:hypothetical protein [Crinalium epipsammum]AFZ11603.1 hypothetical protein Cri9333_0664 [Crinalium epipsammum PCC 9333]
MKDIEPSSITYEAASQNLENKAQAWLKATHELLAATKEYDHVSLLLMEVFFEMGLDFPDLGVSGSTFEVAGQSDKIAAILERIEKYSESI